MVFRGFPHGFQWFPVVFPPGGVGFFLAGGVAAAYSRGATAEPTSIYCTLMFLVETYGYNRIGSIVIESNWFLHDTFRYFLRSELDKGHRHS